MTRNWLVLNAGETTEAGRQNITLSAPVSARRSTVPSSSTEWYRSSSFT